MTNNNLLRAYVGTDAVEIRSEGDGPDVMVGHFATWNSWTEVNSRFEGHFLEQIAPGAFDRSIAERGDKIKVLYDHGHDPSIGNKPLGIPSKLEADTVGMRYEVPLFDATYVNDLKPALRSGGFGASFRFSVPDGGDATETPTRATSWNPDRLPERTLTNVHLYEFGPVTFPAYDTATAGMRSLTDDFYDDPIAIAALSGRIGDSVVRKILAELADGLPPEPEPTVEDLAARVHAQARRQWLADHIYT